MAVHSPKHPRRPTPAGAPAPAVGAVQIFLRTPSGRTRVLRVDRHTSVATLKRLVAARPGQRLVRGTGRQLDDARSLADARVEDGATLQLLASMRGGCPPESCCCFSLYEGTKFFTTVFVALHVVGAIILALLAYMCNAEWDGGTGSGGKPICTRDDSYIPILFFILLTLRAAVEARGLRAIYALDAIGLRRFVTYEAVLVLIGIGLAFVAPSSTGPFHLDNTRGPSAISVLLEGWFVYAIKVLSEEVSAGHVSAGVDSSSQPPPYPRMRVSTGGHSGMGSGYSRGATPGSSVIGTPIMGTPREYPSSPVPNKPGMRCSASSPQLSSLHFPPPGPGGATSHAGSCRGGGGQLAGGRGGARGADGGSTSAADALGTPPPTMASPAATTQRPGGLML